jgi:hypothetical protein
MFSSESLSNILLALATGSPAEAAELVRRSGEVDEDLRAAVVNLFAGERSASETARRLGDELRARGGDRNLANECYRVAFYTGRWWRDLSENPLFAYFTANRAGAPLDKWIHYFPIYTRHLERYRNRPVRVLEIGVYRGGGLEMLQRYLGPDATIVGLDVDEVARAAAQGRYVVELGDQQDPEVLRAVVERHGPFDVVIDDGGHSVDQQVTSIETLFPLLEDGGTYLVEDCHTSYWPEHAQYAPADPSAGSFIDWVKARVDDLNAYHFSKQLDVPVPWATHVDGLHVYDSVVVLDKAPRFAPFSEVSGVPEFITRPRQLTAGTLDLLATRDVGSGDRSSASEILAVRDAALVRAEMFERKAALAESSVARLESDVARLGGELAQVKEQLDESWSTIQQMRRSRSWRLTAPLRGSMARFRGE